MSVFCLCIFFTFINHLNNFLLGPALSQQDAGNTCKSICAKCVAKDTLQTRFGPYRQYAARLAELTKYTKRRGTIKITNKFK